jgi:hypothetical protein
MRKIHLIGLALFAVFAFAAVSVTAASAETTLLAEWLENGKAVVANTPTVSEGELLLEDMKTATDILCSGKFVGTLGLSGVDSVTLVEDLEAKDNSLHCIITAKGACEEANGELITVIPVNLPWSTRLVLMENGEFLDEIFSSGAGNPGYLIECKALGIKVDDTCTGATQTQEKNVTGGVEGIFNESETITPAGNCTIGGTGAGLVVGIGVSTSPAALTVSSE